MEKNKKIKITKIVLVAIAAAGVLSMAVLAPNTLQILGPFFKNKRYNPKYYVNKVIFQLENKGLIEFQKNKKGKKFIRLTEKGKQRLLKYQLQELTIPKPANWDRKWRVIIFDISEKKKHLRNILRKELINLGFIRLQDSVWVFPYECEEVIIMLKAHFCFGREVLYMTVDKIENDKWLKKDFDLS